MNPWLFDTINGWAGTPGLDLLMQVAAKDLIVASFGLTAYLLSQRLIRRDLRAVVLVASTLALAFVLGRMVAVVHPDARPFEVRPTHQLLAHAPGQAFPSDHATAAFALAFAVLAFCSRRGGGLLLGLAALIGFARVYYGLHDPGDVAAGALVGAFATSIVLLAARWRRVEGFGSLGSGRSAA